MEQELLNKIISKTLEDEIFVRKVISKAFGTPKMPAAPKGSGTKMTVYWQGEGKRRPLSINVDTPIPDGYGPNPKVKPTTQTTPEKKVKEKKEEPPKKGVITPEIKTNLKQQISKLKEDVLKKIQEKLPKEKLKKPEVLKERMVREKAPGESQFVYELRLQNAALDYINDFYKRFEGVKVSDPKLNKEKEVVNKILDSIHNRLQTKIRSTKDVSGLNYQEMKDRISEYEQRGLKNLSDTESNEYFKLKNKIKKIETKEAELTQTKSSIEDKRKREELSKTYIADFEKETKPADKIQEPKVKELVNEVEKAEKNGKVNKEAPKKETMLKMNAARFLNKAFKNLKLEKAKIQNIDVKGSAMAFTINFPLQIKESKIRELNKLIQRQYGLTSPAQVNYKEGNNVEFEFSKQKKEDIVRPTFSNAINDLNKYINEKKTDKGLKNLAMVVGYDAKGKPIIGDFTNYSVTSIGTISSPGKGKTYNTDSSLLSMIANYTPDELKLDLIDAQGVGFSKIRKNSPNYLDNQPGMGIKNKEDAQRIIGILENNLQTITDRGALLEKYGVEKWTELPDKSGNRQPPLKLLVIDEYQGLLSGIDKVYGEGSEEAKGMKIKVKNYLSEIQKQGRKVGVVPWVMTQTIDEDNKEYFKGCSTKILYQVNDPKTGQDFLGLKGRDVARNLVDVGQSAIEQAGSPRKYGVGVSRNNESTEIVTTQAGKRK